jgi:hypothetical protein
MHDKGDNGGVRLRNHKMFKGSNLVMKLKDDRFGQTEGTVKLNDLIFEQVIGRIGEWLAIPILEGTYFGWSLKRIKRPDDWPNLPISINNKFIEENKLEWFYFVSDEEVDLLTNAQSWDFLIIEKNKFLENRKSFVEILKDYNINKTNKSKLKQFKKEIAKIDPILLEVKTSTKNNIFKVKQDSKARAENKKTAKRLGFKRFYLLKLQITGGVIKSRLDGKDK